MKHLIFCWLTILLLACARDKNMTKQGFLLSGENQLFFTAAGKGPAIVFIHGGGVDHRMWQPQVAHFRDRFQVITYDIRGHGQSENVANDRFENEDLSTLLDSLGVGRIHLAGLSMGAVLAVDFVLAHPERVAKLLLLSPGVVGVQEKDSSYLRTMMRIGAAFTANDLEGAAEIVDEMTFQGVRPEIPEGLDSLRTYVREAFQRYIASGNHTRMPQLQEAAPAERLGEIACPTLIMHGADDMPYMIGNVQALQAIPNRYTVVIEGAGHLVNMEQGEVVNREIEQFLGEK
jgi:pimeloyl-ACP methyl ester carboxylesterase